MPPMPKHLTKGKYLDEFDRLHSDAAKKADILQKLRSGIALEDLEGILTAGGPAGRAHIRRDWLGHNGHHGPFDSTGWWRNWKGEPEHTLRCGFIRALEISMGLTHYCPCHGGLPTPEPPPSAVPGENPARNLPIDYHWVCGPSRFEMYVNWNEHQVTVVIITPGFPDDDDPDVQAEMEEYAPDNLATLDTWALGQPKGTIFIGQDEDTDINDSVIGKTITIMKPGVVTHHLDISRGGSGGPFP